MIIKGKFSAHLHGFDILPSNPGRPKVFPSQTGSGNKQHLLGLLPTAPPPPLLMLLQLLLPLLGPPLSPLLPPMGPPLLQPSLSLLTPLTPQLLLSPLLPPLFPLLHFITTSEILFPLLVSYEYPPRTVHISPLSFQHPTFTLTLLKLPTEPHFS